MEPKWIILLSIIGVSIAIGYTPYLISSWLFRSELDHKIMRLRAKRWHGKLSWFEELQLGEFLKQQRSGTK